MSFPPEGDRSRLSLCPPPPRFPSQSPVWTGQPVHTTSRHSESPITSPHLSSHSRPPASPSFLAHTSDLMPGQRRITLSPGGNRNRQRGPDHMASQHPPTHSATSAHAQSPHWSRPSLLNPRPSLARCPHASPPPAFFPLIVSPSFPKPFSRRSLNICKSTALKRRRGRRRKGKDRKRRRNNNHSACNIPFNFPRAVR